MKWRPIWNVQPDLEITIQIIFTPSSCANYYSGYVKLNETKGTDKKWVISVTFANSSVKSVEQITLMMIEITKYRGKSSFPLIGIESQHSFISTSSNQSLSNGLSFYSLNHGEGSKNGDRRTAQTTSSTQRKRTIFDIIFYKICLAAWFSWLFLVTFVYGAQNLYNSNRLGALWNFYLRLFLL